MRIVVIVALLFAASSMPPAFIHMRFYSGAILDTSNIDDLRWVITDTGSIEPDSFN